MTYIQFKVSELRSKLAVVRQAISSTPAHVSLGCYRFECVKRRVTITTGNTNNWIQVSLMAGDRYRDGGFCIFADLLDGILPTLESDDWILFEQVNPKPLKVLISCGDFKHEVPCLKVTEFPDLPEVDQAIDLTLSVPDFVGNINNVSFCVSTDQGKLALTGVNLFLKKSGLLYFYATNGHHLATSCIPDVKGKYDADRSFTLTFASTTYILKLISALETKEKKEKDAPPKIESLHLSVDSTHCQISFNDGIIISRLISAEYPSERIETAFGMKHSAMEVELSTEVLRTALKRLEYTATHRGGKSGNIVEWQFSPNELLLTANSPDFGIGEARIPIKPRMVPVSSGDKDSKPVAKPFPQNFILALNIKYLLRWFDTAIAGGVKEVRLRISSKMAADQNKAVPTGDPDPLNLVMFNATANPIYKYIILPLKLEREQIVRIVAKQGSFDESKSESKNESKAEAVEPPTTEDATETESQPEQPAEVPPAEEQPEPEQPEQKQPEPEQKQLELKAPPERKQTSSSARGKKASAK